MTVGKKSSSWIDRVFRRAGSDDRKIDALYRAHIVPLAELARARGLSAVDLEPAARDGSYFVAYDAKGGYVHEIPSAEIGGRLEAAWAAGFLPEMKALARPLVALAAICGAESEESADVSSFVYEML